MELKKKSGPAAVPSIAPSFERELQKFGVITDPTVSTVPLTRAILAKPRKHHERQVSDPQRSDDWLTPRSVLEPLGAFDLDPCAADDMPWRTATRMVTKAEDGLSIDWHGRVFCNPPYSRSMPLFLERMAQHGNGIALIFARTETIAFQRHVFDRATALFFLKGRLAFLRPSDVATVPHRADRAHRADRRHGAQAAAPSVLIAYGEENAEALRRHPLPGAFVRLHCGLGCECANRK